MYVTLKILKISKKIIMEILKYHIYMDQIQINSFKIIIYNFPFFSANVIKQQQWA